MSRRLALKNLSCEGYFSNGLIFKQFRTPARNGALPTPLPSTTSALLGRARERGVGLLLRPATSHKLQASKSPLDCTLTGNRPRFAGFCRNCRLLCPLECALTKERPRKSFRMHLQKARGEGETRAAQLTPALRSWSCCPLRGERMKSKDANSVGLVHRLAAHDCAQHVDLGVLRRRDFGEVVGQHDEISVFA